MIKTREKVGGVSASVYSINTGQIIELEEMPFAAGTVGGGGGEVRGDSGSEGGIKGLLYYISLKSQAVKKFTCLEYKIS